jgi:hypothetical protein
MKTWMNWEDIMLSEISQTHKDRYSMIPLTGVSRNCQFTEAKNITVDARVGDGKLLINEYKVSVMLASVTDTNSRPCEDIWRERLYKPGERPSEKNNPAQFLGLRLLLSRILRK